ncbi:MAG: DUF393 domain-containing protein [Phycisphaerales bacterium]|nr:DUF393 domain-containing protein [Phycisphaerales bacterium]
MQTSNSGTSDKAIILFDGDCRFCNAAVSFICERDVHACFAFAPLDSNASRRLQQQYDFEARLGRWSTIVLIDAQRVFTRSSAALRITRCLRPPWNLLYALIVVPRPVRDGAYHIIAALRYRIAGRATGCSSMPEACTQRMLS